MREVICPECGGSNTQPVKHDGGYECLDCQTPHHESWFWVEDTHMPTLAELLELPDELSDAERGACIVLANHYGVETAKNEAEKILAKHQRRI